MNPLSTNRTHTEWIMLVDNCLPLSCSSVGQVQASCNRYCFSEYFEHEYDFMNSKTA